MKGERRSGGGAVGVVEEGYSLLAPTGAVIRLLSGAQAYTQTIACVPTPSGFHTGSSHSSVEDEGIFSPDPNRDESADHESGDQNDTEVRNAAKVVPPGADDHHARTAPGAILNRPIPSRSSIIPASKAPTEDFSEREKAAWGLVFPGRVGVEHNTTEQAGAQQKNSFALHVGRGILLQRETAFWFVGLFVVNAVGAGVWLCCGRRAGGPQPIDPLAASSGVEGVVDTSGEDEQFRVSKRERKGAGEGRARGGGTTPASSPGRTTSEEDVGKDGDAVDSSRSSAGGEERGGQRRSSREDLRGPFPAREVFHIGSDSLRGSASTSESGQEDRINLGPD